MFAKHYHPPVQLLSRLLERCIHFRQSFYQISGMPSIALLLQHDREFITKARERSEIMAQQSLERMAARRGGIAIRGIRQSDVETCGRIAYAAHSTVAAAHNVPSEHPSVEFSLALIGNKIKDTNAVGFVAERDGAIVGSIFLNIFPGTPVAVVGPLTVDSAAEGTGAGRWLMQAALDEAAARGVERVRLVQSPSHLRSLALYIKAGFALREPLVLCSGALPRDVIAGCTVRAATIADVGSCDQLCSAMHGFARNSELVAEIQRGAARVVERGGRITGYSTGLGFRGYAVAETNDDLKALIAGAPAVAGPGFFVPVRNSELLRWLLQSGLTARWPAALMTMGSYQEPGGAVLPSIAF